MTELCIFDLDGTIMNTLDSISYFVNLTLKELGLGQIEKDKFKYFVGNGRELLIKRSLAYFKCDTKEMVDKACKIYDNAYESDPMYLTAPYDGIMDAIKKIKDKGVKLAVLSNKPDNVVGDVIKSTFGDGIFDCVRGQFDGVPTKPNPDGLLKIISDMSVNPENCVMIGDTNVDIGTGVNAGIKTIGVLWGFRDRDELQTAGADLIIEHPSELPNCV